MAEMSKKESELTGMVLKLRAVLWDWMCPGCGGKGTYRARTKDGSKVVTCKKCGGDGHHPKATQVLKETEL